MEEQRLVGKSECHTQKRCGKAKGVHCLTGNPISGQTSKGGGELPMGEGGKGGSLMGERPLTTRCAVREPHFALTWGPSARGEPDEGGSVRLGR